LPNVAITTLKVAIVREPAVKTLKFACCALAISAVLTGSTASADPVQLDVASTFPNAMPVLGDVSRHLPEKVLKASGGQLVLTFHEPGKLVPAAEAVNAVSTGKVPAAWAGAGWFAAKDSAFNLFSSVPFGPGIGEYLAWLYRGGGLAMAREMFHQHGVHNIPCGIIPAEASGWFQKEVRTVDDLKGLRMRFFGLGAKVMAKHGVVTQQLPPGEILAALKNGTLDATEFSLPAMDQPLGFDKVAKYYYFPGWHQQATLFDLYVNKGIWDGLSEAHRAIIEIACGDAMREMIADGEALQWKAMKEMQADGVELKRWRPEILVSFEKAWYEVVAEESAKNPNFKRVYASYAQFRENYAIWRHFNSLQ
jgi:TRAP-type mannitol/chloroaromatic compound transport system substrate-binding protein